MVSGIQIKIKITNVYYGRENIRKMFVEFSLRIDSANEFKEASSFLYFKYVLLKENKTIQILSM